LSRNKKNKTTFFFKGLGDGGIGTNQQKHRQKQKKYIPEVLGMGGIGTKQKKNRKNKKTKKHIPEVLGMGGSHQEFPNSVVFFVFLFFLGFLNVFLISLHGVLPKETQSIFLCYHCMEVYIVFFCLWF
jgi:hypothetical protein